ncbi:MAG: hypothetical protein VB859_03600 [Planctomycetaceae bacterium]
MSLPVECGLTFLRAVAVAVIACPITALLAAGISTSSPRRSQLATLALVVPFLTPGFVVGYAYSNVALSLARQPVLNELLYDLLLLLQVVPVGTLVLLFAPPPPLGPTADHCRRLVGRQRLDRFPATGQLACLRNGELRNRLPAIGLMALLVFHEFEIASLFRVIAGGRVTPASWSNALFEATALQGLGERNPADLWQRGWLPLVCSLMLISPLLSLLWSARQAPNADISRRRPRPRRGGRWSIRGWLGLSLAAVTIVPLLSLIVDGWSTWPSFWQGQRSLHSLIVQTARSLAVAVVATLLAALVAIGLLQAKRTRSLIVMALPGLLGSLSLGLLLTWAFLRFAGPGLQHTVIALCLGESLWLLPRAALLVGLLTVFPPRKQHHLSRLLYDSPSRQQRAAGRRLLWTLTGKRVAQLCGLLCWWSFLELTINELLAPAEWLSVAHRMYQQMHFGRNGALSAMTLLVILVPLGWIAILAVVGQRLPSVLPWGHSRRPLTFSSGRRNSGSLGHEPVAQEPPS